MSAKIIRTAIALISGYALFSVFNLSLKEWSSTGACPSISGVPACYVVTAAYLAIFLSAFTNKAPLYKRLFFFGAAIVFGLAAVGSFMQLTGLGECPKTSGGFPMCYISLTVAITLIGLFFAREKANKLTS